MTRYCVVLSLFLATSTAIVPEARAAAISQVDFTDSTYADADWTIVNQFGLVFARQQPTGGNPSSYRQVALGVGQNVPFVGQLNKTFVLVVPEPTSLSLLAFGMGIAAASASRRWRRSSRPPRDPPTDVRLLPRLLPLYNMEHHHAGLGLLTPADVHHGVAAQRDAARATVLATHPERFASCGSVINRPKTRTLEEPPFNPPILATPAILDPLRAARYPRFTLDVAVN